VRNNNSRLEVRTMAAAWCTVAALLLAVIAPAAEPGRETIIVLGDSIAAGNGVDPSESFPGLIQERIREKGWNYELVNAGVSGDTTAGGLRRISWLLKRQVHILVLELGGNDGLRGISPDETRANLEKIITQARERYPHVRIVVCGMQMPQNMGESYNRKFREVFPDVARAHKTELVPFLLEGVGGRADLNQPDRIHPNPAGHRIVASNVWSVLEPMLQPKPAPKP
jgi:acyl-CoA thioesterase-1